MDTARAREVAMLESLASGSTTIGELSEGGSTYTNAYSAAPWTLPSHGSLFTGTYPSKHGAHAGHKRLEGNLDTIAETFRANDYETVAVSNNTWISEEFGFGRGFDEFHKTWQYVQTDTDLGEVARKNDGFGMVRELAKKLVDGNPVVNAANAIYGQFFRKREDDGASRTNKWIEQWLSARDGDPFFLFVNYLEPHLDYHPPQSIAEEFLPENISFEAAMEIPQNAWEFIAGELELTETELETLHALYVAEIAYLDRQLETLINQLKVTGKWDNTIFVLTSDHGENIGEHGMMDHQYCLYDTLLHVPLIITGGAFDDGGEHEKLVQTTDIAPTLLDAAGIESAPITSQFQGHSFHPTTSDSPREYVVAEYMAAQPSMNALERQLDDVPPFMHTYDRSLRAIRTADQKLIRGSDGSTEYYDLTEDPNEQSPIADERTDEISALKAQLDDWLQSFEPASHEESIGMSDQAKSRLEELGYIQ